METLSILLATQPQLLFSLALVPGLAAFLWLRRSGRGTRVAVLVAVALNLATVVVLLVLAALGRAP